MCAWRAEEFASRVYNDEYILVDPEYVEVRPRDNVRLLRAMFGDLPVSIRHLDYGGGNGLLARLLAEAGWSSATYDPFLDREEDVARLGKFDLVTAFEVFEHATDVNRLMLDLRTLLSVNGGVLFSTLLSDRAIHADQRLSWWHAAPRNGHVSLFSRKSLEILAEKNGFRFGSFGQNFHMFFSALPVWAEKSIRPAGRGK